ncbi:hypothetical protein VSH64_14445 [Amycolatopsis rhabdoformis]|uniref:Uncharacterized protein n=1 Tax=Amycolatopsis rhabdoformis TaxID=1448059 RepID=A0ABZ1IFQ8_9PSEU|nr:hypothetical protein [Amycolatopsis rhabdoformis]WSE33299.1 hypothetical protein VSH64_14445 [Amycolatopsis rhabdoformis]
MSVPSPFPEPIDQNPYDEAEVRRAITSARWAMGAQAILYFALSVFVWVLVSSLSEADAEGLGGVLALAALDAALAVTIAVCAVLLGRREPAVWWTTFCVELGFGAILLIGGLVTLIASDAGGSGAPVGIFLWLLLAQAVLRPLQRPEVKAAFGLRVSDKEWQRAAARRRR